MANEKFRNTRPPEPWDGVTERRGRVRPPAPPPDSECDKACLGVIDARIAAQLEEGREAMIAHIDKEFEALRVLIKSGYPDGDPVGHRLVHEGYIREAADRSALWKSVREKTVTGAVWAIILLLANAVWEAIRAGVHK